MKAWRLLVDTTVVVLLCAPPFVLGLLLPRGAWVFQ